MTLLGECQDSEIVDIWMKKDTPKIDVHTAEGRRTTIRQPTFSTTDVKVPDHPGHVPRFTSFFAWDVLDEFGETDEVSIKDRVDRFLKAIWNRVEADSAIKIEGKTSDQFQKYIATINEDSPVSALAHNFQELFLLYVPVGQHTASHPIDMYWGTVYEIVQVRPSPLKVALTTINTKNIPRHSMKGHPWD